MKNSAHVLPHAPSGSVAPPHKLHSQNVRSKLPASVASEQTAARASLVDGGAGGQKKAALFIDVLVAASSSRSSAAMSASKSLHQSLRSSHCCGASTAESITDQPLPAAAAAAAHSDGVTQSGIDTKVLPLPM